MQNESNTAKVRRIEESYANRVRAERAEEPEADEQTVGGLLALVRAAKEDTIRETEKTTRAVENLERAVRRKPSSPVLLRLRDSERPPEDKE